MLWRGRGDFNTTAKALGSFLFLLFQVLAIYHSLKNSPTVSLMMMMVSFPFSFYRIFCSELQPSYLKLSQWWPLTQSLRPPNFHSEQEAQGPKKWTISSGQVQYLVDSAIQFLTQAIWPQKLLTLPPLSSTIYIPKQKAQAQCHSRTKFIKYDPLVSARMPAMDGGISKTEVVVSTLLALLVFFFYK